MNDTKRSYRLIAGLALALIVVCVAAAYGFQATASTEFCLSCHEMTPNQKEQKFSSHAKDKDGKIINCAQCHIPQGMGPRFVAVKIYSGVKDLAVHWWQKPEILERLAQQPTARRFIDDANCLACHADLYKDAKGEKTISNIGKLAHDAYLGKNGNTRSNCAGCHINLAHLPEFDQRFEVNAPFKARLLQEEEKL
jgi:nitrate/TMAO reductase-like tetraheme cytochrome c subunit